MTNDTSRIGAIGNLSHSLISRQLNHDDAGKILRRRLGDDAMKDRPQARVDRFVQRNRDDDPQQVQDRLVGSLRQLADRYRTATAAASAPPATTSVSSTAAAQA